MNIIESAEKTLKVKLRRWETSEDMLILAVDGKICSLCWSNFRVMLMFMNERRKC